MRKMLSCLFIMLSIMVALYQGNSLAEETTLPSVKDNFYRNSEGLKTFYNEYYYLLADGDTIHCLSLHATTTQGAPASDLSPYSAWEWVDIDGECYIVTEAGRVEACDSRCAEIGKLAVPHPDAAGKPFQVVISPENKTYLLDVVGNVYQWQPHVSTAWNHVTTLDLYGIDPALTFEADPLDFVFFNYTVNQNNLYASYKNAGDGYTIYEFSLNDGSRQEVTSVGKIYSLTIAANSKLISCCSPHTTGGLPYYFIECDSGDMEKFALGLQETDSSGLVFDRNNGWYYVSQTGSIRHLDSKGEEITVTSIPLSGQMNSVQFVISTDGRKVKLLSTNYTDGAARFFEVPLQSGTGGELTFDGWTNAMNSGFGTLPSFSTFAMEHEQVQSVMRSGLSTGHDVAQALLTKNDAFDILVMNTAVMDLQSLYSKGFFVNLADDDVISAYFDQLYPTWRDACMWRGQIAAFPLQADDRYQFMYNTELWIDLGLSAPKTYAQLFRSIQQWSDEGILDEYPLFEINGNSNRSYEHLFNKLLGDYILRCEAGEQPLDFQDSALLKLLRQLEEMRNLLDKHDSLNLTGTPLMAFGGGVTAVNFDHSYESYGHYDPLMLGFTEEDDPIMQASIVVMVVNPHGKNIELAKDYLSYLAGNPTPVTQCVFLQGMPDGIATIQSQAAKAEWEAEYASCEQQLQVAQASGDADAISTAKKTQEVMLLREPETVWAITPEHARILYHALPYAQVVQYYPYTTVLENGEQILERYLAGQIGAEELMRNLRALVMMIEAE